MGKKLFAAVTLSCLAFSLNGQAPPPGAWQPNAIRQNVDMVATGIQPGLTLIVYEGGAHIWRQIFTDGRPHEKDPNPSWLGDSIGRWDGDTFVIDTIGFNGKSWIDEAGLPTTEKLHVIERIRRVDVEHLAGSGNSVAR